MRNRFLVFLVANFLLLVFILWTLSTIDAQNQEAGKIQKIDCEAYWRKTATSKEESLTKKDEGRPLYVDEGVRCAGKGVLQLLVYGDLVSVDSTKDWYNLPENNAGNENGTGGRRNEELAWMTGTYRLNEAESDFSRSETQFFRQSMRPLWQYQYGSRSLSDATPLYFSFQPEKQRLTFASSETPPLTFSTDGRMITSFLNDHNFQRVQATAAKDHLNITWTLNDVVTALVNVRPLENGKKLIFNWIIRRKDKSDPQEFKVIYDRQSSVADMNLYRPRDITPAANAGDPPSNAVGDVIVAELLEPISMKPGSPTIVALRIILPEGSKSIIGLEVKTQALQTVPGPVLVLQFRGIREPDGRVESFAAILQGVITANGEVLARKSDFQQPANDPATVVFSRVFEFPAGARFILRKL